MPPDSEQHQIYYISGAAYQRGGKTAAEKGWTAEAVPPGLSTPHAMELSVRFCAVGFAAGFATGFSVG